MSDTPETDRIVRNAAIADHPPNRLAATLTVKCEKLERERDEAMADLEFRRGLYKVQEQYLEMARRERDEARKEIEGWRNKWDCAVTMGAKAENERDEAREALMKIEDVFVDGEDTYEGWKAMGNIARAALEGKV
jgi:hypothetical protein